MRRRGQCSHTDNFVDFSVVPKKDPERGYAYFDYGRMKSEWPYGYYESDDPEQNRSLGTHLMGDVTLVSVLFPYDLISCLITKKE